MADKTDFKKDLDAYSAMPGQFRIVEVPELQYLMVDGRGDPNTSAAFTDAIEALYPVAYRLKFASKGDLGRDYVVPPLEGLWWAEDMAAFTSARDKSLWSWTLMIMVPDWIGVDRANAAIGGARADASPEQRSEVRLQTLAEGRCMQTLHVGTFDDEGTVLAQMHHEIAATDGLRMTGRHHEIYLSDFRRVAPERRRTILRQPVEADDTSAG